MKFSMFGDKVSQKSGINVLMDDLGQAMSVNRDMLMLGGGNPAHIPAVQKIFRESMMKVMETGRAFEECVGNYDTPQGNPLYLDELAALLNRLYGWNITAKNIALTNGSQSAFFLLFNMFSGRYSDGSFKKILLPLTPEYIGYADAGLSSEDIFTSIRPEITFLGDNMFKYSIDFDRLVVDDHIGAICVSRPTNPTGNVVSDTEIEKLMVLSKKHGIPLIIDNAYGTPFPNIIFTDVKPYWDENVIMCMSLSKLGLPGVRTGIIIACEEIISAVSQMNAVINLAPGSLGSTLTEQIVRTGEIIDISRDLIRPYYQGKAERAVALFKEKLHGLDFHIHKPEGAIFLWLWFRGIKIDSDTLYERLKKRGVLVVPGHYFFPGLAGQWQHRNECIRVTYSQGDDTVSRGIEIIADEVRKAY
ncbi:MAG TPA: valine--pyruvate transaminase [Spirochaetota bacterium]|nr:valine--pyruvate transaminase [Spirochaetota bacterium]HPF06115.1 valine--pyruvate transaminase [Spirochaetota bacterium]HPJ43974.1 valine--pyruvate transaminase [Spirochaetota bacterium]HPR37201.1 valine--pyruvate transaminase [Spirochaetota bacterium]HRX48285.1 valine--pyruvate transaminase [Spirochaetota bacterium]